VEEQFEGIYVKKSSARLGVGVTSKDCVTETFWFPNRVENGYVELLLVTNDFDRVLNLIEKVSVERFFDEYRIKPESRELYEHLRSLVGA